MPLAAMRKPDAFPAKFESLRFDDGTGI